MVRAQNHMMMLPVLCLRLTHTTAVLFAVKKRTSNFRVCLNNRIIGEVAVISAYKRKQSSISFPNDFGTVSLTEFKDFGRSQPYGFYARNGKRLFDLVVALLAVPILLPLAIGTIALVAYKEGKPIFSHLRVGYRGRMFPCYKFRTMVLDSEARLQHLLTTDEVAAAIWAKEFKLQNDPRVTRFGRFLRETSLDELPQLWNVIRGDMSLVGPRPVTSEELPLYRSDAEAYLSVRPGVTGLWQVSGRNSIGFEQRVKLDRDYVKNLSFAQDIKILFLTFPAVLRKTGW